MTTLSPLSPVDTILVKMIEAYPTLRHTRWDALHDIATQPGEYETHWNEDGTLTVYVEPGSTDDADETTDKELVHRREAYESAPVASARRAYKESDFADSVMWHRTKKMQEAFVRDNAEMIVRAGENYRNRIENTHSGIGFGTTIPRAGLYLIHKMPANADPMWVEAFTGLLEGIVRFNYGKGKFLSMAADYAAGYERDLEAAKDEARKLLIKIKGSDKEKVALEKATFAEKLAKLITEAAQKGVTIEGNVA